MVGPNVNLLSRCHISPSLSTAINFRTRPYPSSCSKQHLLFLPSNTTTTASHSHSHSHSFDNTDQSSCQLTADIRSKVIKSVVSLKTTRTNIRRRGTALESHSQNSLWSSGGHSHCHSHSHSHSSLCSPRRSWRERRTERENEQKTTTKKKSGTANLDVFPTVSVFLSAERKRIRKVMAMADEQGCVGGEATNLDGFSTVSVEWLQEHLDDPDVKVVDASWYLPVEKRDPFAEFKSRRIRGSVFFDLDAACDLSTDLPHMLPSEHVFSLAMDLLGINNSHMVVVYDGRGLFSAPRLWWMLRVFGHDRVAVLEGGLPMWRDKAGDVEEEGDGIIGSRGVAISDAAMKDLKAFSRDLIVATRGGGGGEGGEGGEGGASASSTKTTIGGVDSNPDRDGVGGFKAKLRPDLVRLWQDVKASVEKGIDGRKQDFQVVDARPKGRFDGIAPEPRPDVPSGHIPGSKNVPFVNVLTKFEGGCFKEEASLKQAFVDAGVGIDEPIVAMCGTGVTGCILALALHKLGRTDVPVYDGSWTEWAVLSEEKGLLMETSVVA